MSSKATMAMRFFSPRIIAKAVSSLDKSMALVVSACWMAALVMLVLAAFSVHGAVSAKQEADKALVAEPVLPKISSAAISAREMQVLLGRVQSQFPEVKFNIGANQLVSVTCDDGNKFHQWISALSYIDTMAPQYKWTLKEFCVGACGTNNLMKAVVLGQKMVFSLPQR